MKSPENTLIRRAVLGFVLIAGLCVPSAASADPNPSPRTDLIKVPKSIGGIELGGSLKSAGKGWGLKSCGSFVCSFGKFYGHTGTAEIDAATSGPKVVDHIDIYAAADRNGLSHPLYAPAYGKFETKEGIGLGSPVSKLKDAYPEAKKRGTPPLITFDVKGKGKSYMSFGFDRFNGKNLITSITLDAGT